MGQQVTMEQKVIKWNKKSQRDRDSLWDPIAQCNWCRNTFSNPTPSPSITNYAPITK